MVLRRNGDLSLDVVVKACRTKMKFDIWIGLPEVKVIWNRSDACTEHKDTKTGKTGEQGNESEQVEMRRERIDNFTSTSVFCRTKATSSRVQVPCPLVCPVSLS